MYMLLTIYALTNLNVVSWGTREVKSTKTEKAEQEAKGRKLKVQNKTLFISFSCLITLCPFSLFVCFPNTFPPELEIAEKNKAKQKGNSSLSSFMKYININAVQNKEEGFTIGIGKSFTNFFVMYEILFLSFAI